MHHVGYAAQPAVSLTQWAESNETGYYINRLLKSKSNQLYTVSRTQQGRQREPSVKTFRSPLSAELWRRCVLSGRTQRRALPRHQNEEMKI